MLAAIVFCLFTTLCGWMKQWSIIQFWRSLCAMWCMGPRWFFGMPAMIILWLSPRGCCSKLPTPSLSSCLLDRAVIVAVAAAGPPMGYLQERCGRSHCDARGHITHSAAAVGLNFVCQWVALLFPSPCMLATGNAQHSLATCVIFQCLQSADLRCFSLILISKLASTWLAAGVPTAPFCHKCILPKVVTKHLIVTKI